MLAPWAPRHTVLSVVCFAYLVCYLDRLTIAMAIPIMARDLGLSSVAAGAVLSAFFVGYTFMQIPGGLLADRFGPRILLTASVASFSLMTALTGVVTDGAWLIGVRILFGLGEGPFPAAASKAIVHWFPTEEVGRANGLLLAASNVGATLAPLFAAFVQMRWGWRTTFYALGVLGLLLALLAWRILKDGRELYDTVKRVSQGDRLKTIHKSLLEAWQSPPIRWCAVSLLLSNIGYWGLVNWLPSYLLHDRGLGVRQASAATAIGSFSGAIGCLLGGYLCDKHYRCNLGTQICLGVLASAVFTLLVAWPGFGTGVVLSVAGALLTSKIASTANFSVPLILGPRRIVGASFGVINTAGQLAGAVSPLIIGSIVTVTHGRFEVALMTVAVVTAAACIPALWIPRSHAQAIDRV